MSIFVIQANPIGVAQNVLDEKVASLKVMWDAEAKPKAKWWQVFSKERLMAAVSFFINCVDQLIIHIDQFKEIEGKDKKATGLLAAAILYDYIVAQAMPLVLKPFASQIKQILVYIVLSYVIDFIVDKYRNGLWKEGQNETPAPTNS